jgi:uncharacterized hydrophobic protein (TIGR00271 family)
MEDPRRATRTAISESADLDWPFVLSNLAATVIAAAGLLGNSAATIIGAMLVATLMGPIMGVGLALVDFDNHLLRRALLALGAGSAMVLGVSTLLGLLAALIPASSEMLTRTSPHLLDLITALASGAICAYAVTTPRLSAAIFGVSIAVALVPPLATAGLFLARADWELARGALLLTFVNIVAIQVGTSITLWLRGFRGRPGPAAPSIGPQLRRNATSVLLMAALAIILGIHGLKLVRQHNFEAAVHEVIRSALVSQLGARLTEMTFTTRGDQTLATAVVRSPARFTQGDVAAIARRLPRSPDGSTVRLKIRHIELDVVDEDVSGLPNN